MIITPHLLIGAAIGAKVRYFGWIIVLGLVSHLILDKIPHWDYGQKIEKLPRSRRSDKILLSNILKVTADGLMGVLIIAFIVWQKDMMQLSHLFFIFTGAIVAVLPDVFLGICKLFYYFNKFKKPSKHYMNLHEKILHCPIRILKPTPLGVGTEILVSLIAILILISS